MCVSLFCCDSGLTRAAALDGVDHSYSAVRPPSLDRLRHSGLSTVDLAFNHRQDFIFAHQQQLFIADLEGFAGVAIKDDDVPLLDLEFAA